MGGPGPHSQFRLPSRLLRRRGARSVGSGGDRRSDGACRGPKIDMPIFGPGNGSVRLWTKIGRATSELQSLMRISYAVFCLKKTKKTKTKYNTHRDKNRREHIT